MYKKTVIAEIRKNYALLIDEDGAFHRICIKKGMRIGDRVTYRGEDKFRLIDQEKRFTLPRWVKNTLAVSALLLTLGIGTLFNQPEPMRPQVLASAPVMVVETTVETLEESQIVTIIIGEE